MDLVGHALVVGVGVDRRHQALLDAEGVVEDLGERGEAVGGAGGVGDDLEVLVDDLVVHAQDDRGVQLVLGRGAQDDAPGAGVDVLLELLLAGEEAGGLQGDLAAEGLPRQVGRVLLGGDRDLLAVDDEGLVGGLDRAVELLVDAVVLQQVGQVLGIGQVVDRDDLELLRLLGQDAEDEAADAAEAIDTDADSHRESLLYAPRAAPHAGGSPRA